MSTFPKGFPKDGVADLKGKEYITKPGLVWLATNRGPWSSSVDHVERVFGDNGLPIYIEVTVTVTDHSGDTPTTHTAIGDAGVNNVGKMISNALPRMAHTRALGRALAASLGIGRTTAEEMPPDDVGEAPSSRRQSKPAPRRDYNGTGFEGGGGDFKKGDTVETSKGNVGKIFWLGGDKGDRVGVGWGEGEEDKEWTYLRFLKAPSAATPPPVADTGPPDDGTEIPF
jgi:hypothetical protein